VRAYHTYFISPEGNGLCPNSEFLTHLQLCTSLPEWEEHIHHTK
jgi:hypothetical protein